MKEITDIVLKPNSREEWLPQLSPDFPYTASRALLDQYDVTWHWHRAVELFYMESGTLEYHTPGGTLLFPQGTGGLVNTGVLHTSRPRSDTGRTIQLLHLFDPSFIAGPVGGRIECTYVAPFLASFVEILPVFPNGQLEERVLKDLRESFDLSEGEWGYEIRLRDRLSSIWVQLLRLPQPAQRRDPVRDDAVKAMLAHIHEHYPEPLRVQDLAAAAFISQRECYRLFQQTLHTTPMAYLRGYRLQMARRLLTESEESVTRIGFLCGFDSSSAFIRSFRETTGFTPSRYRKNWQERNS